ncbi:unnamed protein product [Arctogadus glacialis]
MPSRERPSGNPCQQHSRHHGGSERCAGIDAPCLLSHRSPSPTDRQVCKAISKKDGAPGLRLHVNKVQQTAHLTEPGIPRKTSRRLSGEPGDICSNASAQRQTDGRTDGRMDGRTSCDACRQTDRVRQMSKQSDCLTDR